MSSDSKRVHMSQPSEALSRDIERLICLWQDAWNAHDMHAAAELVMREVDFVVVSGRWLRGRAEFLQHHFDIHRMRMRDSTWATLGWHAGALNDESALVHVEWEITGERDFDGTPRPSRSGVFTWITGRAGGSALILAAQNTNHAPGITPRLASRRSR